MIRKKLVLLAWIIFPFIANAQTDEDLVRHTLMNYLNGTSFNQTDQIKSAFHPESNLYLEGKEETLMIMPSAEYTELFAKRERGKFNGRYGKILDIDMQGNLALAKAEILLPSRNKRYLDVFILRRMPEGNWLIISKAANSKPIEDSGKN